MFLLFAAVALFIMNYFHYTFDFFDPFKLLILTILTFMAKGFFATINDTPLFLVFIAAIFFTLYYPLFQIILFFFLAFFFMKLLRVI
jgi:hypothetical protein